MYLQKAPNGVYQTRICIPKLLRKAGYPFDIKVSLLTKERSEAIERNFTIAHCIKSAISQIETSNPPTFSLFKVSLNKHIDAIRNNFKSASKPTHPPTAELITFLEEDYLSDIPDDTDLTNLKEEDSSVKGTTVVNVAPFTELLTYFLNSKSKQNITALTHHQLNQRIAHCINFLDSYGIFPSTVKRSDLMDYVDLLISEKRSAKTNKAYLASVKQFFFWLKCKDYISKNPTESLNPNFKSKKHASEQRDRWTHDELMTLFTSAEFGKQSEDFQWITKLQLYHGLRTGEACQPYIQDIMIHEGIPYFRVTDQSEDQHLKNKHAVRDVPLHPAIRDDFIAFYKTRRHSVNTPLFHYTPLGVDKDWTKTYRTQFGKLQTKLGMKARARPTAYGLRHTFIDELKEQDVLEHSVAEVVGHTNPNMTFGRYGKKHKLDKLLEVVSQFEMSVGESL
ncbi:tyrosine-type recombinase/integrase [Vibrio cyclitrophicus]|uniref:tyrosine-type recombinase/integrase n=1 Tax=Vibrio TaxID=662 RepID=UPI000C8496CC|nr:MULTISPECIES: tyrosine-type recombinase/integrase [Vibrio]PMP49397.1 integrase [Vibrio cyclitrophicus]UOE82702.1 tyrosine-type recombinase/integrase [Vibrio splendidus]